MSGHPAPLLWGEHGTDAPLALLLHGFPDTPATWRHLAPALAEQGYRVAAPFLPGYGTPAAVPVSGGAYVRAVLDLRHELEGDARTLVVGHDWGAQTGYGLTALHPERFSALVALAVPPGPALRNGLANYAQLKRSFYIWLMQREGLAEAAMQQPGFWEGLWADWSPGYDGTEDVARFRELVPAAALPGVLAPYRANLGLPGHDDPAHAEGQAATRRAPGVPTLYLHGTQDGGLGADMIGDVEAHLPPGSGFQLVPGVGHFLHLEQPDLVRDLVLAWLDGRAGRPAPGP